MNQHIILRQAGRAIRCILILLLTALLLAVFSPPAAAATALTVQVCKDGQIAEVAAYTEEELAALGTVRQNYSSLDATGAPVVILAEGVPISTLFATLGIPLTDTESLRFISSDGGNHSYGLSTYVTASRWYYPQIVDGYDAAADTLPAFTDGAEEGKTEVPAIIALSSYEGRYESLPDPANLSVADGLRFCFGQGAITEAVSVNYGKHIISLTITLVSGSAYQLPLTGGEDGTAGNDGSTAVTIPPEGLAEELDTTGLMADTLTITVGYYGGTYYTKKVFTTDELAQMSTVEQVYSLIDNMPAVCLDAAVGVPLADILTAAGIDLSSIQTMHFYCADVSRTWYTSMTKAFLLDTPRYYYPQLAMAWDYDNAVAGPGATAGAVQVDTIIAVQDKWRRMATEIDFSDLTDTTRFRLVFGQSDVATAEGSRSAKWIHTIAVTLGGSPPTGVSLDVSVLELTVGSEYQLTATVGKTDDTTDTRVKWSSSDENVASVDKTGKITVIGEGEAVITATTVSGGLTAQVVVNGSAQAAEAEPIAAGTEDNGQPGGEAGNGGGVYRIRIADPASADGQTAGAAVQLWRNSGMAAGAVALPELKTENPLTRITLLALVLLFAAGMVGRIIIYRLEV